MEDEGEERIDGGDVEEDEGLDEFGVLGGLIIVVDGGEDFLGDEDGVGDRVTFGSEGDGTDDGPRKTLR